MTRIEYGRKCEELCQKAITLAKQANVEYNAANDYMADGDECWEVEQRKADQHYGYAEGINQVLVILGFKSNMMKELSELL